MHEKIFQIITELKGMGSNKSFTNEMLSKNDIHKYLNKDKEL
jgi:hypothetical protein